MKNLTLIGLLAVALAGCASKPAPPSWKANAADALKSYSDAWLKGNTATAEREFVRARGEMASTGRPDLVAHAELYRCATRAASLEFDDCPGFAAVARDSSAADSAYAAYISGRWQALDPALLPEQHQAVVRGGAGQGALASIEDPLSRLVAAGATMKAGRLAPADITVAIETASGQGWRRPLLVWLGVARKRAEAAGDSAEVARIQRRIDLVAP